jgi:hypothetical protein
LAICTSFSQDVRPLVGIGKAIVLASLKAVRSHVEEIENWNEATSGKSIVLTGDVTESGLRRIFRRIEAPNAHFEVESDTPTDNTPTAAASQLYFKSVNTLLKDLAKEKSDAVTLSQAALWAEKYAAKIDNLSQVQVDPDLLDYGLRIGTTPQHRPGGQGYRHSLRRPRSPNLPARGCL